MNCAGTRLNVGGPCPNLIVITILRVLVSQTDCVRWEFTALNNKTTLNLEFLHFTPELPTSFLQKHRIQYRLALRL